MKEIKLIRVRKNDCGTWGVLEYNYQPFALTREPPWHDNKTDISCIPPGIYPCKIWRSSKRGLVIRLYNVPGRKNVLMHTGNYGKDTLGCQLVGEEFGKLNKKPALLSSRRGFKELLSIVKNQKVFKLNIVEENHA